MRRAFAALALGTVLAAPAALAADVAAKNPARPVASAKLSLDPAKGRFHQVHTQKLQLACDTCHVTESKDVLFLRGSEAPRGPGPVERATCLGCHEAPARPAWYGGAKR